MERPTITIGGKVYEMPKPKAGIWRKLMLLDKENTNLFSADFIEKRCEFMADAYGGGLTAEFLLDNLDLDEVTQIYTKTTSYILSCIVPKLEEVSKNVSEGDKSEQ